MLALTVPTAGTRPVLLDRLVRDSGLDAAACIVVATRPDIDLPPGVTVLHDLGPINIHRWWNIGIDAAVAAGATHVAVVNDDVTLSAQALHDLVAAQEATGATIASPARAEHRVGLHRGHLVPYSPRLWGALWVLDARTTLRPDEVFRWWYGDNDLDIRARRDHGGVVSVDVPFAHHHSGEHLSANPELEELARADWVTFEERYRDLLARSDRLRAPVNAWRRLRGRDPLPS